MPVVPHACAHARTHAYPRAYASMRMCARTFTCMQVSATLAERDAVVAERDAAVAEREEVRDEAASVRDQLMQACSDRAELARYRDRL